MTTCDTKLTVPDAAAVLGVDYTRLDKLIRDGFLGDLPAGSRWRSLGFPELLAVAALLRLRCVGVANRVLRRIVPELLAVSDFRSPRAGSVLLVAGDRFEVDADASRLAASVAALGAEPAVVLGLGPLGDEIKLAMGATETGRD